jgi:hypothetical protein
MGRSNVATQIILSRHVLGCEARPFVCIVANQQSMSVDILLQRLLTGQLLNEISVRNGKEDLS